MPDSGTLSSPDNTVPAAEGTSLWNLHTQAPEWIPLAQVKSRLASGAYRTYGGSDLPVAPGIGGEAALSPTEAVTAVTGGATPTHSESYRDLEARKSEFSRQYDNAGDKALAVVDGLVSGLSADLVDTGTGGSAYEKLVASKRREEHPNYETLGQVAALAATALAPESLLKYTPLGGANELFGAVAGKVAGPGAGILRRGIAEAAGGAVASGALSTAHAVGQAVQGKPVSGYAIIDDIGMGAAIGGGIGLIGAGLGKASKKIADAREQVAAAAGFDESAVQVRGILTDVSQSWHSSHNISSARVEALDDLVKSGMLEGELPGEQWLSARNAAKSAADSARAKLHKLAGTEDAVAVGERVHDLAISGKAKDAEKLYKAFDEYGTAVSALDDAMQPTTFDTAHLHDVIGDIDIREPASANPMQRLEAMINNGSPKEEIEAFANSIDEAYNKAGGKAGPNESTVDLPGGNATSDVRGGRKGKPEVAGPRSKPDSLSSGRPKEELPAWAQGGEVPPTSGKPFQDTVGINDETVASKLLGGSTAGNEQAGFQAKKILDQARVERATGVMSPVRPTVLGDKIQALMDRLTAATGNRLGSPQARSLANALGMNTASMNGPVSQKLADLWSLHRMSENLAEQLGRTTGSAKQSLLVKALGAGAVSATGSVAYHAMGAGAAGTARSLMHHALGAALFGAASVTAVAGRFRQSAVNGMAKALNPTVRKALTIGAMQQVISSSYEPNTEPTTDFNTKSSSLRQVLSNPKPVRQHLEEVLKPLGFVDPQAYTAAVDAGMERLTNLAKALPSSVSISVFSKSKGPSAAQIHEWHMYEAVTADRELVFKYLKAGVMPQSVVESMNEQHPDFMNEIRQYVLNNPDEVQSATHATKMALSRLLGIPLVPEADPLFVQRMQEPYQEAKQKASQHQQQAQGAGALHAPPGSAAQLLVIQTR